ncbi:MAG: 16S rRNA (uracil(1498)-N(3))-methyltransferase [Verrucomicrobia bacterium]|nr:MAG: 16S rRNA (uracil(1498)-N(3))-methyltransferase [Verrucomicrobiota bacterium]
MPRFYLPPHRWLLSEPQLDDLDAHHAAHVLRCEVGDSIVIFDGKGTEALATIINLKKKGGLQAVLSVGVPKKTLPSSCPITLAQAIPKAKNMDLIIQKAVELGASRVIPLLTERTIVRCDNQDDALQKQERWKQIAIEACKQSGQNWLPQVEKPCSLPEFLKMLGQPDHLLLIACLENKKHSLKEILKIFPAPQAVTIMIGPEGDFTPKEYAAAKEVGFHSIDLGPIILRAETAAFYSLSVLSHELNHQ